MTTFFAKVVKGSGRGKELKVPTFNLDLNDVPPEMQEGIYACKVDIDGTVYKGVCHYGPRPVFQDSVSFEVHLLDDAPAAAPEFLCVQIAGYIREVKDFPSKEDLLQEIQQDIEKARAMLASA